VTQPEAQSGLEAANDWPDTKLISNNEASNDWSETSLSSLLSSGSETDDLAGILPFETFNAGVDTASYEDTLPEEESFEDETIEDGTLKRYDH
jgi:hypothetical protein